jgi:fatty-acyl-CoA synthase
VAAAKERERPPDDLQRDVAVALEPLRAPDDPRQPWLTIAGVLEKAAERFANRPAVISGGASLTYAELHRLARSVAAGLVEMGVGKGTRVGLLMPNRIEWLASAFGAATIGALLIPISTFASPPELEQLLRHGDVSHLIVQNRLLKRRYLEDLHKLVGDFPSEETHLRSRRLPNLRRVVGLDLRHGRGPLWTWTQLLSSGQAVADSLLDELLADVHPSDDAVLIYTSGSSAEPKGVLHMHRAPALQGLRWAEALGLVPDDRVWSAYPFFWVAGFAKVMLGTLSAGACLILQPWFDAAEALSLIGRHAVTTVVAASHQMTAIADLPAAGRANLRRLRNVNPGPLAKRAGLSPETASFSIAYGLSEAFTMVTRVPASASLAERQGSNGLPYPGNAVRVVDPDTEMPLPAESVGEIAIRALTFMRGYHKRFREDYLDSDDWFRTKDSGYLDKTGRLHWTGRLSTLIKSGQANVSPLEIEAVLNAWGKLKLAAAVGLPHPDLGEAVVVCAVLRPGSAVSEASVVRYLRSQLASYKVPKRVFFVPEQALHFTATDKVKVQQLRALAAARIKADQPGSRWAIHLAAEGPI